ncbi:hypothetical protein I4F81_010084 [Pyropia yezoensis]|uniref:Uncharacterized protein n=1 Tax=Pyropia yezoensis TaxID=2788 RepID=A0ACC3CBY9_PYRYE|nr:hypothetical protein I4F81_010084 [Neopyropia yezoensis]
MRACWRVARREQVGGQRVPAPPPLMRQTCVDTPAEAAGSAASGGGRQRPSRAPTCGEHGEKVLLGHQRRRQKRQQLPRQVPRDGFGDKVPVEGHPRLGGGVAEAHRVRRVERVVKPRLGEPVGLRAPRRHRQGGVKGELGQPVPAECAPSGPRGGS